MTTERWAGIFRDLGHRVTVTRDYDGEVHEVMVALHARRSAEAIRLYRESCPDGSLVLALTGTDLYRDIHRDDAARESLHYADRFVLLQPEGVKELPENLRDRARVIYQSISDAPEPVPPREEEFEVSVIGHLRAVKDPFRAEKASRRLPEASRIRITHVGGVLEPELEEVAEKAEPENPRYRWLGERSRKETLQILARSRLLVHSSRMEGGAHVISEAIACETPVLASNIPGNVGMLGKDYPGYFQTGSTSALADRLKQAETDSDFLDRLREGVLARSGIVEPERERTAWRELIETL